MEEVEVISLLPELEEVKTSMVWDSLDWLWEDTLEVKLKAGACGGRIGLINTGGIGGGVGKAVNPMGWGTLGIEVGQTAALGDKCATWVVDKLEARTNDGEVVG